MNELKLIKCLLTVLVIISTTMAVWAIDYINTSNSIQTPSAFSAFSG